ncbi:MAG: oxidoreductase [Spirochaetales bacterium]|nr:MAG: oxidoreductase [Spirochaetales bacterium]
MKGSRIGICVIGSGRAGMIHARNFASGISFAGIVAVADPVEEAAKKAAEELEIDTYYLDYRRALEDKRVDAVVVVTPTVFHREIVLAAAAAGKHVLWEKPMAMNAEECRDMIEACAKHKVKLQIGFMRRFDKSFRTAKERIDRGDIGRVVLVKSLTHGPSVPQPWMYDIRKSNGPLAEVNSHDIDTLRWFTGSEFAEVYAVAGNYRCPEALPDYPDFYDNVLMNARFKNGMQGSIDGAVSVKYGYDARTEVLGTDGIMFIGHTAENAVTVCSSRGSMDSQFVKSWRTLFSEAYRAEDEGFIRCILEDSEPCVTGVDGKMAVKVVNAGNASIIEKKPIILMEE